MKIFASDYDGTLRVGPDVSEDNKKKIQEWRDAGNLFVMVTGRSMESILSEIERNRLTCDYIIGNNGGVIYDQTGKRLKETVMDFDRALEVLAFIKTVPCFSYVINDGFHRAKVVVDATRPDRKYGMIKATKTVEEVLANRKIAQFVLSLNDMQLAKQTAKIINERYQDAVRAYVNVDCIDVVPSTISKAEGIHFLKERCGIAHEDIYVIGDSYNDLPMIEAYHGFTLNHAEQSIQKQASASFESVASAIDSLLGKNEESLGLSGGK